MKYNDEYSDSKKKKEQERKREHRAGGFKCSHCKKWVVINNFMGTINRNHCNMCLWSKHVDEHKGDRKNNCHGGMRPIGLTFKHEGIGRQGELMLVHECASCGDVSINRIAGDDSNEGIVTIFDKSISHHNSLTKSRKQGIDILVEEDRVEINMQLFGKDGN